MGNMSYCRFRNTKMDLDDCLGAMDFYENEYEIDREEVQAGVRMFTTFLDYCADVGIIDDYNSNKIEENFTYVNERIRERMSESA